MWEADLSGGKVRGLRDVPATTAVIIFILVCVVSFAGVFAYVVNDAINQTRARLEERSQAAALNLSTNVGWMAQVAHQTLRRVDLALGPTLVSDPEALQAVVEGLPTDIDVYIIDAGANTLFATIPGAENVNVADREYFLALQDGAAFYTSGLLVSRINGDNIFVFSKRVERDGQFAGAIMVSLSDDVLAAFWRSLDLDAGSTLSLIRRDGELMARYPPSESAISFAQHPLITEHLASAESGTYNSEASPIDGIARMVSYRAVPGTEILALASVSTNQAWQSIRGAIIGVLLSILPIFLGLIAIGIWIVRLLGRDEKRRAELEAAQETNVLLFREIHHRVKNNLQSVQSLVRMQDMPRNAKIDLQSRLSAMAAMHEHIYRHDRYEDIDAHALVPVVVDEVVNVYGGHVEVHYDIDHATVDRDHATPLSLLLSELVTNALKYAFADGRAGQVSVILRDIGDGRASLVVADNGVGMSEQPAAPTSMGMRLIKGIVMQMGGTYSFVSDNGTRFEAELALANKGHATAA